ncbi:MAG: TlyA family RNA methyltransferase [Clostridiales bacterium]|nr:TlyA family RNA methyltransferase [Clostridiales bacterium]
MAKKERLDVLLVENNYFESREKAKRAIMSGVIFINQQRVDKPGMTVPIDSEIEIKGKTLQYVSRGGLKLEKAIENFPIDLNDKVCMDIGASTGGFTDCMLQSGARKVFSVDVGYGQLDWKLRNLDQVINMERTNIRYVTLEQIGEPLDFVSIDVSFISLKLVLPVASSLMKEGAQIVFLIKPQFEAGREKVKKNGVVRDPSVHEDVIRKVLHYAYEAGFQIENVSFSPITGPKGNIEFLGYGFKRNIETDLNFYDENVLRTLVEDAHNSLKK